MARLFWALVAVIALVLILAFCGVIQPASASAHQPSKVVSKHHRVHKPARQLPRKHHKPKRRVSKQAKLIAEYEPYSGCTAAGICGRWAIPVCMVTHESEGEDVDNGYGSTGLYQIQDGTWASYGGLSYGSRAMDASKLDQSIVARRILVLGYKGNRPQGIHAWSTASVCGF